MKLPPKPIEPKEPSKNIRDKVLLYNEVIPMGLSKEVPITKPVLEAILESKFISIEVSDPYGDNQSDLETEVSIYAVQSVPNLNYVQEYILYLKKIEEYKIKLADWKKQEKEHKASEEERKSAKEKRLYIRLKAKFDGN